MNVKEHRGENTTPLMERHQLPNFPSLKPRLEKVPLLSDIHGQTGPRGVLEPIHRVEGSACWQPLV